MCIRDRYWIVSCITYRIGVWSGADVEGAILVNAVTGEHQYYPVEEVPSWVDRVYHADLIIEQLNLNGKYQNGFWNAYFGQRGVLMTTDGYNYIAVGDDVYLYTGMTSVAADQSNVGFVLVNMRTKETKFYTVPGATEKSAQRSAQGQVQDQGYTATFPLLLNVNDRPTYFMSLKAVSYTHLSDAGRVRNGARPGAGRKSLTIPRLPTAGKDGIISKIGMGQ